MNIESAIVQMLRGELGILIDTDDQSKAIYDACEQMGIDTTHIAPNAVHLGYELVGLDEDEDLTTWYCRDNFEEDRPYARVEKFSDLICENEVFMESNPYSIGDRVVYIHPFAGMGTRMPRGSLATVTLVKTNKTVDICFDDATSDKYKAWSCHIEYLEPAAFINVNAASPL